MLRHVGISLATASAPIVTAAFVAAPANPEYLVEVEATAVVRPV